MPADVITFPAPQVSCQVTSQGGDYTVHIRVHGSARYPMKGGQGGYEPRTALLVWTTGNGGDWTFRHAIVTGPQIEERTGKPSTFPTSQTIYLGDPGYPDCEPDWLAGLVDQLAPRKVTS